MYGHTADMTRSSGMHAGAGFAIAGDNNCLSAENLRRVRGRPAAACDDKSTIRRKSRRSRSLSGNVKARNPFDSL